MQSAQNMLIIGVQLHSDVCLVSGNTTFNYNLQYTTDILLQYVRCILVTENVNPLTLIRIYKKKKLTLPDMRGPADSKNCMIWYKRYAKL